VWNWLVPDSPASKPAGGLVGTAGKVTATGAPATDGTLNFAAVAAQGFGFDPAFTNQTALDLTAGLQEGFPSGMVPTQGKTSAGQAFVFFAQALRDECTAAAVSTLTSTLVSQGTGGQVAGGPSLSVLQGGAPDMVAGGTSTLVSANPSADPSTFTIGEFAILGTLNNISISDGLGDQESATSAGSPYIGNLNPGVWNEYYCEYEYSDHVPGDATKNSGLVVASACVLGVAPVVCQIHQTPYYLDCTFIAEKVGGPPDAPMPCDYPNWQYLNARLSKPNLDISADGVTLVYKASGQMRWLWTGVDAETGLYGPPDLPYPIAPWLSIDYETLPDLIGDVDPNLLDATD
jgi:hypothetical protein